MNPKLGISIDSAKEFYFPEFQFLPTPADHRGWWLFSAEICSGEIKLLCGIDGMPVCFGFMVERIRSVVSYGGASLFQISAVVGFYSRT